MGGARDRRGQHWANRWPRCVPISNASRTFSISPVRCHPAIGPVGRSRHDHERPCVISCMAWMDRVAALQCWPKLSKPQGRSLHIMVLSCVRYSALQTQGISQRQAAKVLEVPRRGSRRYWHHAMLGMTALTPGAPP
jgi:hypothetical protein